MSTMIELPENSRYVQPKYLEESKNKKDLIRRLRNLVGILRDDATVEVESPEWPGLAAVSHVLVQKFINHSDKEVRLYSCLACIEIFCLYAPEVPWDAPELLTIFRQITTQLGNLAHTKADAPVFMHYSYMLDQLANVRIACLLVDLVQHHGDDNSSDSDDADEDSGYHKNNNNDKNEPLEVLVELFHTLLNSVRREHSPELLELVRLLISGCLEEYHPNQGVPIPIPILDELLHAIGQGPKQWVLAPNAGAVRSKKSQQLPQQQVPNHTYTVAAKVVRTLLNKLAAPLADLLNGLLRGDPYVIGVSTIQCPLEIEEATEKDEKKKKDQHNSSFSNNKDDDSDTDELYTIIFELHRVAPTALTTVIGNITSNLGSVVRQQRYHATVLLGRLFATASTANELDDRYGASVFREWLGRRNDVDVGIRVAMVRHGMHVLKAITNGGNSGNNSASGDSDQVLQIAEALEQLITLDQSFDVRAEAVRRICDWAYAAPTGIPVTGKLLQAVAARVRSKHRVERRDALTGLAHVYSKQWVEPQLKAVSEGGDDCELAVVAKTLHDMCHLELVSSKRSHKRGRHPHHHHDGVSDEWKDISEERYGWIPATAFNCGCYTDQVDPDMRSRLFQIFDELLLGKKLTPTAQAIALTAMVDSLVDGGAHGLLTGSEPPSAAFKFLQQMLQQRAQLQKTISTYLDARAEMKNHQAGTAEADECDARAMEMLESVAKMTAPVDAGSKISMQEVLQDFHSARDKHIFRLLSTITNPDHSAKARKRALEELPKRAKSLGDGVALWVKNLVKRCAMGNSLNSEVIRHCVLLALECFRDEDVPACGALLATVKTVVDVFPALGSSGETYATLTELFSDCREAKGDIKKELHARGIVTVLSSILSSTTSAHPNDEMDEVADQEALKTQLVQLCTRDGTPEQARNAVHTLAKLLNPSDKVVTSADENFTHLLQTLTSASRLKLSRDKHDAAKLISILSALSALAECAPLVVASSTRAEKAVKFALERVLLGRDPSGEVGGSDSEAEGESDDEDRESPSPASSKKRGRFSGSSAKKQHATPEANATLLEDENLSVACRRICAAADFLVSHIRSIHLLHKGTKPSRETKVTLPQKEQVQRVFELLVQMLEDQGYPPSSRDRAQCKSRQDRAALRQCAAVSLFRLCDPRLDLHKDFLTKSMWTSLGQAFLDEELVTREAVMHEFADFLKGHGVYASAQMGRPPSLRFLAFVALCCDGDREHDAANASAANVGKAASSIRSAAFHCVENMRKFADAYYTRCSATSKEAEQKYETQIKFQLMPEYAVPYVYHLLSHRRETPGQGSLATAEADSSDDEDGDDSVVGLTDESQQRILRKRLKLVFDPLVSSLGDGADNISFLLRMTDELSKRAPVDVSSVFSSESSPRISVGSNGSSVVKPKAMLGHSRDLVLQAKLKTVCTAAREVLLTYVKKDVNLTTYPGVVQIPRSLFQVAASKPISQDTQESIASTTSRSTKRSRSKEPMKTPAKRSRSREKTKTPAARSVLSRRTVQHRSGSKQRSEEFASEESQQVSSQETEQMIVSTGVDSTKHSRSKEKITPPPKHSSASKRSRNTRSGSSKVSAMEGSGESQPVSSQETDKSFDSTGGGSIKRSRSKEKSTAPPERSAPSKRNKTQTTDLSLSSRESEGSPAQRTRSADKSGDPKAAGTEQHLSSQGTVESRESAESPVQRSSTKEKPTMLPASSKYSGDKAGARGGPASSKSPRGGGRVHFSPDVKFDSRGRSKTRGSVLSDSPGEDRLSLSPLVASTVASVGSHGRRLSPRRKVPGSSGSSDTQTLGSTPPSGLKTATMMTGTAPDGSQSPSDSLASSQPSTQSATPRNNSAIAATESASPSELKKASARPATQGSKSPSTQSSLSSTNTLKASQESGETEPSTSAVASRRSKRRGAPVLKEQEPEPEPKKKKAAKKQRRGGSIPSKIVAKTRKASTLDPLDFDFEGQEDAADEENKPVGRNSKRGGTTAAAAKGGKAVVAGKAKAPARSSRRRR